MAVEAISYKGKNFERMMKKMRNKSTAKGQIDASRNFI